jgi:hypothetical protein
LTSRSRGESPFFSAFIARIIECDDALKAKQDLSPRKLESGPMPTPPMSIPRHHRMT